MLLLVLVSGNVVSHAHQDPCHRLHSCPSDHGTYVYGDKGPCDQYPENQYCLAGMEGQRALRMPQDNVGIIWMIAVVG